ncbi:MAG TPA: GAP family protein [Chitinophagaceae bacterium]|nr:GAP family protein [Chitinophagaceae bacterium]
MINILFEIFPYALGIAISPVPIITVILSLFSVKAKWNGPAFVIGWALGILVVCIPILMLANTPALDISSNPSKLSSGIRLSLGVFLFGVAILRWVRRPKSPDDVKVPKWLMMIEAISPFKVLLVGFFFAVVTNPKNFALTVAATLPIANSMFTPAVKTMMVTAFILISCVGVGIPVVYYMIAGESARKILNTWKTWLVANNSAVMAVLFLVFGAVLFSEGLQGLL